MERDSTVVVISLRKNSKLKAQNNSTYSREHNGTFCLQWATYTLYYQLQWDHMFLPSVNTKVFPILILGSSKNAHICLWNFLQGMTSLMCNLRKHQVSPNTYIDLFSVLFQCVVCCCEKEGDVLSQLKKRHKKAERNSLMFPVNIFWTQTVLQ